METDEDESGVSFNTAQYGPMVCTTTDPRRFYLQIVLPASFGAVADKDGLMTELQVSPTGFTAKLAFPGVDRSKMKIRITVREAPLSAQSEGVVWPGVWRLQRHAPGHRRAAGGGDVF